MRLIDADELKKTLTLFSYMPRCKISTPMIEVLQEMVDAEPTIDPVKHGHWIRHGIYFECSYCHEGEEFENHGSEEPNYCLNCGAIMDEEVSDEVN